MFILFRDFNVIDVKSARLILPIHLPTVKKSISAASFSFRIYASFILGIGDRRIISDAALATVDTIRFDKVTHLNDIVARFQTRAHIFHLRG